jgi:actin-related protein 6
VIPNIIFKAKSERRRAFIGDQIEECKDYSGLFYVLPFSKGYLVNWDIEKQIWNYMYGKEGLQVKMCYAYELITATNHRGPSIQWSVVCQGHRKHDFKWT